MDLTWTATTTGSGASLIGNVVSYRYKEPCRLRHVCEGPSEFVTGVKNLPSETHMKPMLSIALIVTTALLSKTAIAADSVMQPYRPANATQQWTIEGQTYGLMKVRVLINGQVVADGEMKNGTFTSTYLESPIRVSCTVGRPRLSHGSDHTCTVYVDNELAANLVFRRNQ
jgi:hypothetical protein